MIEELRKQMNEFFVGKEDVVDNLLICLFAGGHVLIEDVPGVGKTTVVEILARSVQCDFGRIQFTPDTLPGDVVGTEIYNMKNGNFEFCDGAVMHQIILADEINRTSPKTQSSLLEAMAEGHVTVCGVKHELPTPFMVIATQNPVEFMGTYKLPEAQLDRFMMKISIGYPSEEEEIRMAKNELEGKVVKEVKSIITSNEVVEIKKKVLNVLVKDEILVYIRNIIDATRKETRFILGASPRALIALLRASQAKAYMEGRDYVKPDDVKAVSHNVLCHRLVLTSEANVGKDACKKIFNELLLKIKAPR